MILDQLATGFGTDRPCLLKDQLLALDVVEHDRVLRQDLLIFGEIIGLQRLTGAEEAMALGQVRRREAFQFERNNRAVEDEQDALQRAHPTEARRARAHRLRPREAEDHLAQHGAQHIGGLDARLFDPRHVDAVLDGQLVLGQADLAQEAFQRLRRRAIARPLDLFADRGRFGGQAVDDQGQAARADIALDALEGQARGRQLAAHQAFEILRRRKLHAGGDFFGEQFNQQLGHQRAFRGWEETPASSWRAHSWAHALQRSRMRPMYDWRSATAMAPRASIRLNRCDAFSTWS